MANEVEKVTKETVEKGGVLALLYFDLHGKDKSKLSELGVGFVNQVLKEPGVVFALGEINEPEERNDMFSTSLQLKVLCKSFLSITNLCEKYSPFSLEILKPDKLVFTIDSAQELLMNISTTTFEYKKHIIEKLSSPEELEGYRSALANKLEMGKKLFQKGEKK
ncbi:MAG: hypothetical protein ABII22_06310 [Candidatus Micrarchaeota archaeon]